MAEHTEHRWVVDGIEDGVARIEEDGSRMIHVPASALPAGVTEGQVLRVTRSPGDTLDLRNLAIVIDAEATAAAQRKSVATTAQAMAESKKRDSGGDVVL